MNKFFSPLLSAEFCQQIAAFRDSYLSQNSVKFAEIAEGMRQFTEGFPEQVLILAQNGWFISSDHTPLGAIYPVADLFRTASISEGHKQMCAHFSRIRKDIEDDLAERFPDRRRILDKAFKAHDVGDYELCVPVFLAQADGMAKIILDESIYTRAPRKVQNMSLKIATIAREGLEQAILGLALEALPLTNRTDSPAYQPEDLNRHAVLHGIDTQYATELNSYRAISLLQYAAYFEVAAHP